MQKLILQGNASSLVLLDNAQFHEVKGAMAKTSTEIEHLLRQGGGLFQKKEQESDSGLVRHASGLLILSTSQKVGQIILL